MRRRIAPMSAPNPYNENRSMLFNHLKRGFVVFIDPLIQHFINRGYHPDTFTIAGVIFNTIAGVLYAFGFIFEGALVMLFGSTTDLIDGQLARKRNEVSKAGALLDSTLDRYSESAVLVGLVWYFASIGWTVTAVVAALAIAGSLMVSYVRARAEGLGFECNVGFMQRPERVIFLAAASVFGEFFSTPNGTVAAALWLLAIGTHYTTFERMIHVRRKALAEDRERRDADKSEGKAVDTRGS